MLDQQNNTYQQRIEKALGAVLPLANSAQANRLDEALSYAVLGGGKRVRPLLVYATGEALGFSIDSLDKPAVAIELMHAYSLIHDDLPCMDDDDLRRGKKTVHREFDEATAVLTGDALQALAFDVLSSPHPEVSPENQLTMLNILAKSSGISGMVMGQAIDLAAVGQVLTEQQLEQMHNHKTGALIRASVLMASYCSNEVDNDGLKLKRIALQKYAEAIGLAFQVRDDILDIQSDTETLGKQQGSDIAADKPTYPSIMGMNKAKEKLFLLHQNAIDSVESFGREANLLRDIAAFIVKRIA
jgi:geranylgeranyl pyrophosphate synthase